MSYTATNLGITESQLQSLLQGDKIFVEKRQFEGDVALPLTKAQAANFAKATRGINLKLSSRQIKAIKTGEGWLSDLAAKFKPAAKAAVKAAAPFIRKQVDRAVDVGQAMIPTAYLGPFKPVGDHAVAIGRKHVNKLLDRLQKMLGGAAGRKAIDAQLGAGFFDQYLMPSLETAAKIGGPFLRGGGNIQNMHKVVDEQMGEGWFKDYLLPGLETSAKIATPFLKGSGLQPDQTGHGFFSDIMSQLVGSGFFDIVKGVANIGSQFVPGVPGMALRTGLPLLMGRGPYVPKNKKNVSLADAFGEGMVL
jgi:hypothetical protein